MKEKENIERELRELSPLLADLKKENRNPFKTPEGYFESFEDRMMAEIERRELERPAPLAVVKSSRRRMFYFAAAAAVTAGLLVSVWLFRQWSVNAAPETVELTTEDIEAYVYENVQDFDAGQLAAVSDIDEELPENAPEENPSNRETPNIKPNLDDLRPEDVEHLLDDMSAEELEEIL